MKVITKCCYSFCIFLLVAGCNRDYSKKLPNNYKLIRTNPSTVYIITPETNYSVRIIVPPTIVSIGFSKDFVYGKTIIDSNADPIPSQTAGHFILDTKTATVELGLSESEFNKNLLKLGVKQVSGVVPPARF